MPGSAIRTGAVDHVLPVELIGPTVSAIVGGRPVDAAPTVT
jgi:hypothetical protein